MLEARASGDCGAARARQTKAVERRYEEIAGARSGLTERQSTLDEQQARVEKREQRLNKRQARLDRRHAAADGDGNGADGELQRIAGPD
jgi:chromosome segregation ATPase